MICPPELQKRLVRVEQKDLIPGETVWWPLSLSNWGCTVAGPTTWYPSAQLFVERHPRMVELGLVGVRQTIVDGDDSGLSGNCLQAALATLLSVPPGIVPHFALFGAQWKEALD